MNLVLLLSLIFTPVAVRAAPVSPIKIQPADSKIAQLYIAMLDRDIAERLKVFDPQTGLLQAKKPQGDPPLAALIEPLSLAVRKKLARDSYYAWSYAQSRHTSELAGAMAYAYSIPASKFYKNPNILDNIRAVFDAFAKHQSEEGEFVFSPMRYSSVWGTHEMAWRLEPLICAYTLIRLDLSPAEQKTYRRIIEKGMRYLLHNENNAFCNRGMVWCGVMALCYRFTGDREYLQAADRVFEKVRNIFAESGEVREGPGPDLGYSNISIQYLFLYRLTSEYKELDEILIRSLKWYTRLFTFHAMPLEGMTTRQWLTNGTPVASVLGPLMYYAEREPSFGQIATRYLEALIDLPGGFALRHGGGSFLRGSMYHKRPDELKEIPYEPYAQLYESDHSLYYLVGRNYQTAVTLRGRKPLKGMQTWSYKGEPPLIVPSRKEHSRAMGMGFDSGLMDVPWESSPASYLVAGVTDGINLLTMRQGLLTTAYLFSQDTTAVIYRQEGDKTEVNWIASLPAYAVVDEITEQKITFHESEAAILLPGIAHTYDLQEEILQLHFSFKTRFLWFTFAGPDSHTVIRPVGDNLVFVQLHEPGKITNVILNMSTKPFTQKLDFPGTKVPIPPLAPFSGTVVHH